MNNGEVIRRCASIINEAGYEDVAVSATNFLDYSNLVRDIVQGWPKKKQTQTRWLKSFALQLRKMRDDFEAEVAADPLSLYKPAHSAALEFHQSLALVRYYRAPNRTSKTQGAVQDNYWVATGQHPYRPRPPLPSSVAVIGTSFTKYCPQVFEAKYLYGEAGNPLSPAFPEDGKWFVRYDARKHIIYLACPACAEKKKAKSCKHPHSRIILFSDNEGPLVLAGGQYGQVHMDEQIGKEFFPECIKRIETVPNSGIIVTETPLGGKGFWTHKVLTRDARAEKMVEGTEQRLVTLHTIDQFAAGLTSHERIKASMEMMSPAEVEARVFGRPAAFAEHGVFDHNELDRMSKEVLPPRRGALLFQREMDGEDTIAVLQTLGSELEDADGNASIRTLGLSHTTTPLFVDDPTGELRLWSPPDPLTQYFIGVDVAQGLLKGDASCAQVMAVHMRGTTMHFEQVASLHGWVNPRTYAQDVMRLAIWYNSAMVVPERNGPGHEFIRSLREFGYWNIFRDVTDPAQSEFQADPILGITTSGVNKGSMIALLQQCIKDRKTRQRTIILRCEDTIDELGTYEQHKTDRGSVSFNGINGSMDDRVMALTIVVYAAKAFGLYDYNVHHMRSSLQQQSLVPHDDREIWGQFHTEQQELRQQLEEWDG